MPVHVVGTQNRDGGCARFILLAEGYSDPLMLDTANARQLARDLIAAADELDAAHERGRGGPIN
jgi:hypothetical protein